MSDDDDDIRRHIAVPITRVTVQWENCGHQAVRGVWLRRAKAPRLKCSVCESQDVEFERVVNRPRPR